MNWHSIPVDELYTLLGTSAQGLDPAVAAERLVLMGENQLKENKRKNIMAMLLAQFKDTMMLILLLAALISALISDLWDALVILCIVLLNATMGFLQEYQADKAIKALKKMSATQAEVVRAGICQRLPTNELVPGDLVRLEVGNAVPADLRLIETIGLQTDEAALTGESAAIAKTASALPMGELPIADQINMAFKGSYISYGRGAGVVVATAMETELGKITKLLQQTETLTPLQKRLAAFAKKLSLVVMFICLLFFVSSWLRGDNLVKMLLTSISLAVSAIPEALPAVVAIALALAAKRMVKQKSLIRKLPAVETLGSVSYICTDKTGTLTMNEMHVEKVFVDGVCHHVDELANIKTLRPANLLLHAAALNNDAVVVPTKKRMGDGTEIALKELALQHIDDLADWPRLGEIAFDHDRKLMTTFHAHGPTVVSFTKGAPDVLIARCKHVDQQQLLEQADLLSAQGYRVFAFAYRQWHGMPKAMDPGVQEHALAFLGLIGMIDPPRKEAVNAITACKKAGITPVMVTGDHPLTARAVALRVGILNSGKELTITGTEMAFLDQESLMEKVEHIKVYARVAPAQKLQIIDLLQQKGHCVAMTGDGVNDAPSLKKADIGIAMGLTGTDVAKEAAHMVLLDDNFSTIVAAVREGRRVYDNILKFIKYLMTTNSSELLVLLLGPMIGLPVALLPIQILWINLVSDGLPAVSLSFEKAEYDLMDRKPRNPLESVFDKGRGMHMLWVGMFMAGIVLSAQALAIKFGLHWQTIVFNLLSISQMAHLLAIRSNKQSLFAIGLFSNRPLVMSVLAVFVLQAMITYIPFLQFIFGTQTLSALEFVVVALLSSLVFFAVEIEKYHTAGKAKLSRPEMGRWQK